MTHLQSLLEKTAFGQTDFGAFLIPVFFLGVNILLALIIGHFVVHFVNKLIDKTVLVKDNPLVPNYDPKRAKTLRGLLKNTVRIVVAFITFIIILNLFGINTTSIIASAGVVGLAISFGAQSLIKDIITGFFIILENYYAVGEYVQINQASGYVEEVGLRSTKIRDYGGELHIFPNGTVSEVTNYSRGKVKGILDISIAYEADVSRAIEVLREVCLQLQQDFPALLSNAPDVLGITALGSSDVVIQVVFFSGLDHKYMLERELRKRAKTALEKAEIEIPYPKMVVLAQGTEKGEKSYGI